MEALVGPIFRPWSDQSSAGTGHQVYRPKPASLARRFAFASAVSILLGMTLLGFWMTSRLLHLAVGNAANSSALFMESFFEPLAQKLSTSRTLAADDIAAIDAIVDVPALRDRLIGVRLWLPDGTIVYAGKAERSLINTAGPLTPSLIAASEGKVQVEYGPPDGDDIQTGDTTGPMLEIYTPLHLNGTDTVIAIAEYYVAARELEASLSDTRLWTWLMVGAVTFGMFSVLYAIVFKASRLIDSQRRTLEQRVIDEMHLNSQNSELRAQLQQANRRSSELNERYLRRVSSELHDGPAQHLALALLRLDELKPLVGIKEEHSRPQSEPASPRSAPLWTASALDIIKRALTEALREIRNISSGLALPELDKTTPAETLGMAIRAHERNTCTTVERDIGPLPQQLPLSFKICLYRFAQEGLNNAFRHAGGKGQRLRAAADETSIEIEVADDGPGFSVDQIERETERLGLIGLRHRVRSLGGNLVVQSEPGKGTKISVRFPYHSARDAHV